MNQKKHQDESEISTTIYSFLNFKTKFKLFFIGIIVFVFSFILHFPLKRVLEKTIQDSLSNLRGCPITYKNLTISYFLPDIELKEVTLGRSCFQRSIQGLTLESISVRPVLPSIFPLGPKFHLAVKTGQSHINIYAIVSFSGQQITITRSSVHTDILNQIIGVGSVLSGHLNLEGSFKIKDGMPNQGAVFLQSQNIATKKSTIQGINLPQMSIGIIDIRVRLNNGQLVTLEKADLGSDNADIVARFNGSMNLNMLHIPSSSLNLEGSFSLGDKITRAIPLINIFLKNKQTDDGGFYRVKLTGTMGMPTPQLL